MPDPIEPINDVRNSKLINARLDEIERTLKAIVIAIKDFENEIGVDAMPTGEYYGQKFE